MMAILVVLTCAAVFVGGAACVVSDYISECEYYKQKK